MLKIEGQWQIVAKTYYAHAGQGFVGVSHFGLWHITVIRAVSLTD
jgi:hypothetical protein